MPYFEQLAPSYEPDPELFKVVADPEQYLSIDQLRVFMIDNASAVERDNELPIYSHEWKSNKISYCIQYDPATSQTIMRKQRPDSYSEKRRTRRFENTFCIL